MDIILRKWRKEDAGYIVTYANNKNIAKFLRDAYPFPYTLEDATQFINSCVNNDVMGQDNRAIVVDNEVVGSIGLTMGKDVYRKSAELGYWLAEPFWSRSIMSNTIKQMCSLIFSQYDIVRIFATPFAHNTGSRKALEKAGFTLEAVLNKSVFKDGEFYDSCIYALIK